MGTEFELKYRSGACALESIAAQYPGGAVIPMTTTYYDTPDGALSAKKWTLRHRQEGDAHICTLKTPSNALDERREWEVACEDIHRALADLSSLSGIGQLRDLELIPTCGARFTRTAIPLTIGESTAELALDRGELVNGERSLPFAEVEVELKSGSKAEITAFARDLAHRFGLEPEPKSKFARAKALGQEG